MDRKRNFTGISWYISSSDKFISFTGFLLIFSRRWINDNKYAMFMFTKFDNNNNNTTIVRCDYLKTSNVWS